MYLINHKVGRCETITTAKTILPKLLMLLWKMVCTHRWIKLTVKECPIERLRSWKQCSGKSLESSNSIDILRNNNFFSLRSRRLEVMGERENGRARGRHARGVSLARGVSFAHYFQEPATQATTFSIFQTCSNFPDMINQQGSRKKTIPACPFAKQLSLSLSLSHFAFLPKSVTSF